MKLTEKKISWTAFMVAVLLQGAVGWIISTNTRALIRQDRLVSEALAVRAEVFTLFTRVLDADNAVNSFLMTGATQHLESFERSKELLDQHLQVLQAKSAAGDEVLNKWLGQLTPRIEKKMDWLGQIVQAAKVGRMRDEQKLSMTLTGAVLMEEVRSTLRGMVAEEQDTLESLRAEADKASRTMLRWVTLGGACSLALMIVIFAFLRAEIDKRKAAQKELAVARDAALQSARMKSEFLANMSHEIRTPMNAVIGMTDLLAESALNTEQKEYVRVIRQSGDALLDLIDDILDLSKIEAGKMKLEQVEFDLRERVENVVDVLADRAYAKGLDISCLCDPDLPDILVGDPVRIHQVLTNLVSNAIKFTIRGDVVVRARPEHRRDDIQFVLFEVLDTGVGLSPEARESLFRPFTQADGSTTRKFGGTGLGLAISRQLVEIMGGEIGVESEEHKGSRFWFRVPMRRANTASSPALAPIPGQPRVLVHVSQPATRQALLSYIHALGAVPVVLDRHEPAVDKGPALAILIEKGEMAAEDMELARGLRKMPLLADTPVLYLTSLRDKPNAQELRALGMTLAITKPVKLGTLAMTLKGLALLQQPGTPPAPSAAEPRATPSQPVDASRPFNPTGRARILLVEDNEVNQMVAFTRLEKFGFKPDLARNGKEALMAFEHTLYDLILMDCQMPEMDGYQATEAIRRLEKGRQGRTPIVALTAHAISGDRDKCLAAGMDDYLSKPFKPEDLRQILEKWLGFPLATADETAPDRASAPPPPAPMTMDILREVTNNAPDRMRHLADVFLRNSWLSLQKIKTALESRDGTELGKTAHGFAGSSVSFGAERLALLVREVETAVHGGQWDRVAAVIDDVRAELTAVDTYLRKELDLREG